MTIATLVPKSRDLGGFTVRRVLPALECRSIGPFVFFDVMGPLILKTGLELEVRPHPHIGLATLTWLFEGGLMHRDSLGSVQVIHPGEVNLMTAGQGIVHSERASQANLQLGDQIHGAQFWLGLPKAHEDCAPAFAHHPAESITDGVILGEWQGTKSPVQFPHPALCADISLKSGERLAFPPLQPERGVYIVSGAIEVDGERHDANRMLVLDAGATMEMKAIGRTQLLLIGGEPLDGPRYLDWNFVASSKERLVQAREDWKAGRFAPVPGESEFIPYPT
jgi:redox-sensitive bicupin YhaK (pirin superfamily)